MTSSKKELNRFVQDAQKAIGPALRSVILHGAEAHGERYAADQLFLLVVLADLELTTLAKLRPALGRWIKHDHPMPRFFTDKTLLQSTDVFPMELSELAESKVVLHGSDPFADIQIDAQHLRLQIEREIREKVMRLQEAYADSKGGSSELGRLMAQSYPAFVSIFRGCLRLIGDPVPQSSSEVVSRVCEFYDLQSAPFITAGRIAQGDDKSASLDEAFADYYQQLVGAVFAIDSHGEQQ